MGSSSVVSDSSTDIWWEKKIYTFESFSACLVASENGGAAASFVRGKKYGGCKWNGSMPRCRDRRKTSWKMLCTLTSCCLWHLLGQTVLHLLHSMHRDLSVRDSLLLALNCRLTCASAERFCWILNVAGLSKNMSDYCSLTGDHDKSVFMHEIYCMQVH